MVILTQTFLLIPTFLLFVFASMVQAVTPIVEGGQLVGARGVIVTDLLGETIGAYDVRFQDGSCVGLFSSCNEESDFTFPDQNGSFADLAIRALDQVFVDGADGFFDTIPSLTAGCESSVLCRIFTPYNGDNCDQRVPVAGFGNRVGTDNDSRIGQTVPCNLDFTDLPDATYAKWTLRQKPDFSFKDDGEARRRIITQAVYGSKKLVRNRTAVIQGKILSDILSVPFTGLVKVTARLGKQFIGTVPVVFNDNKEKEFQFEFSPERDDELAEGEEDIRELVLHVDPPAESNPNGDINESKENNNKWIIPGYKVVETKDLVIPSVFIEYPLCRGLLKPSCDKTKEGLGLFIQESNAFMRDTYPLDNDVTPILHRDTYTSDFDNSALTVGESTCRNLNGEIEKRRVAFSEGIDNDFLALRDIRLNTLKGAKRLIGFVPPGYFAYHKLPPDVRGLWAGSKSVLVEANTFAAERIQHFRSTAAHEIFHSFLGGDEGYGCEGGTGNTIDGYRVYEPVKDKKEVLNAYDFMDSPIKSKPLSVQQPWVNKTNWDKLVTVLNRSAPDPALLSIIGTVWKDGKIEMNPWGTFEGIPDFIEPGNYSVILKNNKDEIISTISFKGHFKISLGSLGIMDRDYALIGFSIPYPLETATVEIIDHINQVLYSVDPVLKTLNDGIKDIPDLCFISSADADRATILNGFNEVEVLLQDSNPVGAKTKLQEIQSFAKNSLLDNCRTELQDSTKEDFLFVVNSSIERLNARIFGVPDDPNACYVEDLEEPINNITP